jgi:proteasome lid subunit RPN8/RPN11
MSYFRKKKKNDSSIQKNWRIKSECLRLILECAKSNYPREFGGLLRRDEKSREIISEIVLLPGTVSGDSHAIFRLHMLPIDFTIVGTVHSHPSLSANPSNADIDLFRKYGKIHIIAARPYDESSWKAYDYIGNEVEVEIV